VAGQMPEAAKKVMSSMVDEISSVCAFYNVIKATLPKHA
jgi:hypothetical protein